MDPWETMSFDQLSLHGGQNNLFGVPVLWKLHFPYLNLEMSITGDDHLISHFIKTLNAKLCYN